MDQVMEQRSSSPGDDIPSADSPPGWDGAAAEIEAILARAASLDRGTGTSTRPKLWCASGATSSPPDSWILIDTGKPGWPSDLQLESITGLHVVDPDLSIIGINGAAVLANLWRAVVPGGFLGISFNCQEAAIDFDALIGLVLETTLGRVLTEELVVHDDRPPSVGRWATVVWTRLGPSLSPPPSAG
jgi:hypothetical protein